MIKLNLIPPYKKEEIRQAKCLRVVLNWEIKSLGILLIFIIFLLSINYILKINLESLSDRNTGQIKKIGQYDLKIKEINSKISEADKIQSGHLHWKKLFDKLNENFSSEIEFESVGVNNCSVLISGLAAKRDDLLAFEEKLKKEDCFSEIDLPLSNLVSKENVDFQIKFNMKKDCLK